jgi:hypothetical protein
MEALHFGAGGMSTLGVATQDVDSPWPGQPLSPPAFFIFYLPVHFTSFLLLDPPVQLQATVATRTADWHPADQKQQSDFRAIFRPKECREPWLGSFSSEHKKHHHAVLPWLPSPLFLYMQQQHANKNPHPGHLWIGCHVCQLQEADRQMWGADEPCSQLSCFV